MDLMYISLNVSLNISFVYYTNDISYFSAHLFITNNTNTINLYVDLGIMQPY